MHSCLKVRNSVLKNLVMEKTSYQKEHLSEVENPGKAVCRCLLNANWMIKLKGKFKRTVCNIFVVT